MVACLENMVFKAEVFLRKQASGFFRVCLHVIQKREMFWCRRRDVPEHCHLEKPKQSPPTSIPTTSLTSRAILRRSSPAFYKQKLGSWKTTLKEVINLGKYSMNIFLIINSYSLKGFKMESENLKCFQNNFTQESTPLLEMYQWTSF